MVVIASEFIITVAVVWAGLTNKASDKQHLIQVKVKVIHPC